MEEYLHPELISKIMTSEDIAYKSRELSKKLINYSSYDVYHTTCNKNISENELHDYIIKGSKYGFIQNTHIDDNIKLYNSRMFSKLINNWEHYCYFNLTLRIIDNVDINNSIISYFKMDNNIPEYNFNDIIYIDLLTCYRIFSNRLNCMNINKNYALNKTFDILENIKDLPKSLLFSYLYINYKVMTIPYTGDIPNINSDIDEDITYNTDLNYIYDNIPIMINKIKNYIILIHKLSL
jgi:hypothetical protein